MKAQPSNNYSKALPLMYSILFFCLLFSTSYSTLSEFEVFICNMESSFSNEKNLPANEIESETEEDAANLFIIESKKMKFVERRKFKIPSIFSTLISSPSYDIHLPPPKNLLS